MEFKDLIKKILRYNKNANIDLIQKAYEFSYRYVKNKNRLSGQPWINHYIDVTNLITDLKVDDATIISSLMHGIISKAEISKSAIEREFGLEVASIVEGIEKLTVIKKKITTQNYKSSDLRKVLLAASKDIRIILIKLCDKLSNMRELQYLDKVEQNRIAQEVMDIYAPLAYRLGIGKIKSELEDLAFKTLQPKIYNEINNKIKEKTEYGQTLVFRIKKFISEEIKREKIEAEVYGRVKSVYSIYKKLIDRNYRLGNMYDIVALRIITKDIDDCYKIIKIIHNKFRPVQGKFKDYIAVPKPNGYQSLHTAVFDSGNNIIEFQIRTQEMHDQSEGGIASHFEYKGNQKDSKFDKRLAWIKQIVSSKESHNLDIDLFSDHIFVFTPKGKMIELPYESTSVDFAYYIHRDIGNECTGAIVNGKITPLKTNLDNGDIVEIITSKNHRPSSDWLKFVRTSKARTEINRSLKQHGKLTISGYGKKNLEQNKDVEEGLIDLEGRNVKFKLAKCCSPMPGDKITGKKTSSSIIKIHKDSCESAKGKSANVKWKDFKDQEIMIIINGTDRAGFFAEILNSIAALGKNISNAKGKTLSHNDAECSFNIKVINLRELLEIIKRINKVQGVKRVYLDNI